MIILSNPQTVEEWEILARRYLFLAGRALSSKDNILCLYFTFYAVETALKSLRTARGINMIRKHNIDDLRDGLKDIPKSVFTGQSVNLFNVGFDEGDGFKVDFTILRYQTDQSCVATINHTAFLNDCSKVVNIILIKSKSRLRSRK